MNSKIGKKAAMEMSMGTIVTIVLVVVTLVLALVLIRTIFGSSTNAITSINSAIEDQINQLFASSESSDLVVAPASQTVSIKRGSQPAGFAFSVKNWETGGGTDFMYNLTFKSGSGADCNPVVTDAIGQGYILAGSNTGTFHLGAASKMDSPTLVRFNIPKDAPVCTLTYVLTVTEVPGPNSVTSSDTQRQKQIYLNIQ